METKDLLSPRKWLEPLKSLRGENTAQLVEKFTEEMTLVAQDLSEEQGQLTQRLESLARDTDRAVQKNTSAVEEVHSIIATMERDTKTQLSAIERDTKTQLSVIEKDAKTQLAELEKRLLKLEEQLKKNGEKKKVSIERILSSILWIACVVCGSWVLVTILNMFK